jgi:hypothetical protein
VHQLLEDVPPVKATVGSVVCGLLVVACGSTSAPVAPRPTTPFEEVIHPGEPGTVELGEPTGPAEPTEPDAEVKCEGEERWDVKVGTDADAADVDLGAAQEITIAELRALPKPAHVPNEWPRQLDAERTVFILRNVALEGAVREDDVDYHMVISAGDSMIVEVPHPSCMGGSKWKGFVRAVRATVDAHLKVTGRWKDVPADASTVTVVGVGFFDKIHGQRGHAPNGIELHPVLDLCFGQDCELAREWVGSP